MGPQGCDACSTSEICIDDQCVDECPDDRSACSTIPEEPKVCCEGGQSCCPGPEPGSDLCIEDGAPCETVCPDSKTVCSSTEYCQLDNITTTYACIDSCQEAARCGDGVCCPLGSRCSGNGECTPPDLAIAKTRVASSMHVAHQSFSENACVIQEGCIDAPGNRKLLKFDLQTPNFGQGDLFLGDPDANDLFEYSTCHQHYHFLGYARYTLVDDDDVPVANGHKQAFCLLDLEEIDQTAGPAEYDCGYQGISEGWSDVYDASLPCQWVDITDVPAGDYRLKVEINYDRLLLESSYANNVAFIPVTIASDACPAGCANTPANCCAEGNPCNLANNDQCDCDGFFDWDAEECTGCETCTPATTCPGGCTDPATDVCCDPSNPCGLGTDGICQCAGTELWDAEDCTQCVSADPSCAPVDSCPAGCTGTDSPCCADGDPCGWSGDGSCDCNNIDWDQMDCSSCACPE